MSVTGIILAGGKSSRLGQEKGLVELNGRSLMSIAIDHLSEISDEILISANSDLYDSYNCKIVRDVIPGIGPMGGIHAGLHASSSEWNLILSVDLPFINKGLLEYLNEMAAGFKAAVPRSGNDHFEPLCACYHISILPVLEKFMSQENYKLPDVFRTIPINPLLIDKQLPFFTPHLFLNINTKDELRSAKKLMKNHKLPE